MLQFKEKIIANFDQAAKSYDNTAIIQKVCGEFLCNKIYEFAPDLLPQSILDLGAGTGFVSKILSQRFKRANFTLNDISSHMLDSAKKEFATRNNFKFVLGDLTDIDFDDHDLIVSNLALQWIDNLELTLQNIFNKSKILAFSCLSHGTFQSWYNILQNLYSDFRALQYPNQNELLDIISRLKPADFSMQLIEYKISFTDAKSLMVYLKKLGTQSSINSMPNHIVKNLIQNYKQEFELNYQVFFAILKR